VQKHGELRKRKRKMKTINNDILKAIKKLNREEEIGLHGKQISFRTLIQQNKKRYNRKKLSKIILSED
jgi:hypothetical protein